MARRAVLACLGFACCLQGAGNPSFAPDTPPVAAKISFSEADAAQVRTISGAAGAVPGGSWIAALNVDTGHTVTAKAAADGSFSVSLTAPAGTHVEVKADPLAKLIPRLPDALNQESSFGSLPGTLVRVPEPPYTGQGVAFHGAGTNGGLPFFTVRGTINKLTFQRGETLTVEVTLSVHFQAPPPEGRKTADIRIGLARLTGADGEQVAMNETFASATLTPTGLPVERHGCGQTPGVSTQAELTMEGDRVASVTKTLSFAIPASLGDGIYQPYFRLFFQGLPRETVPSFVNPDSAFRSNWHVGADMPNIRIGSPAPPRLFAVLFADTWSHGVLGARAIEDRARYAVSAHVATQTDRLVLPRFSRDGSAIRYRLEPHLPLVTLSDRGVMVSPPRVPLRFPSGSLRATLEKPGGPTLEIGPLPVVQSRFISPARSDGRAFDAGSRHPADFYQVSTMDPSFEVAFDRYGLHRITLEGSVEDVWGTSWRIAGTWEVMVAEPLVLDTAVLPGTPLETGDRLSFAVTTIPPVPATIETRVRFSPGSDAARMSDTTTTGVANRFGYLPYAAAVKFDEPGELRVDVTATWVGPDGVVRAGSRTWGSVVAGRDGDLVAHGRRGMIDQSTTRQPWYQQAAVGPLANAQHPFMPFFGGDVVWAGVHQDAARHQTAMITAMTFQDVRGDVAALLGTRCGGDASRLASGEGALLSSRPDGWEPHLDRSAADVRAYGYASVQRPLFRVREIVGEDPVVGFGYWQFREHYGAQPGVDNGDGTNDFKFLFGGAVLRGPAIGEPRYAIYGGLWVHIPFDDAHGGTRVMPPFRGNGGGPDGGPLFTLKGQDVDLFFHPTAVRPGTILHRGQRISFAGYSAPTLPSRIEIEVTSPSGFVRTIRGQASAIGYFHDPAQDFDAFESGLWKARVRIVFDGRTSAGQVTAPFPAGGVLGSRAGEFYFYVVDADSPPLAVELPLSGEGAGVRPADGPVTFRVEKPGGLTDVRLAYTTTMPGFVLEEGTKTALSYTLDAPVLAKVFPNLDLRGVDGAAGVETITISLLLSGKDPAGWTQHFARQLVIQGEEVQMPEQTARPKRRAVR